eukprot:GEMP01082908.1.p1 GENE.GEMP01082908.1~~GEMP01082908.1.p1  ORF type:complete len:158 (+),score=1.50 GEMP01082908.1:53-475(+)
MPNNSDGGSVRLRTAYTYNDDVIGRTTDSESSASHNSYESSAHNGAGNAGSRDNRGARNRPAQQSSDRSFAAYNGNFRNAVTTNNPQYIGCNILGDITHAAVNIDDMKRWLGKVARSRNFCFECVCPGSFCRRGWLQKRF